ncbi:MAG: hypothetical protein LBC39_07880 [Methanobrevibacter sp.]|jgi:hypothetical protein|nr:hypothetical protein [Candidatus Methanovirga aequatorialis]
MNRLEDNKPKFMEIGFDDVNYSIYKIGFWKNEYKVNLTGKSNEIPVTESTIDHVILTMKEIRKSSFTVDGEDVNGILALSLQLDSKLKNISIEELITIEEREYKNILKELKELKLENPQKSIKLDNDQYLIYKLEKEHHITIAKPANKFTEEYHIGEIERLKEDPLESKKDRSLKRNRF